MADVDKWLCNASKITLEESSGTRFADIQQRIAAEPTQEVLVARHDVWRAVLCAAVAALVAFTAMDRVATSLVTKSAPTWVATPSAASPYGLLKYYLGPHEDALHQFGKPGRYQMRLLFVV